MRGGFGRPHCDICAASKLGASATAMRTRSRNHRETWQAHRSRASTGGRSDLCRRLRRFVGRPEANGPGARAVKHHCHPVVAICARGSLERRRPQWSFSSPWRALTGEAALFSFDSSRAVGRVCTRRHLRGLLLWELSRNDKTDGLCRHLTLFPQDPLRVRRTQLRSPSRHDRETPPIGAGLARAA